MTEFEQLAYDQGRAANQAGISADQNPYDEPQPVTAWARGWWDAERERHACEWGACE